MKLMNMMAISLALTTTAAGAAPASRAEAARHATAASLSELRALDRPEIRQALGFSAPAELDRAGAEPLLPVYMVRLDALRAYRGDSGVGSVLTDTETAVAIVTVDGHATSSILLRRQADRWKTVRIGGANRAKLIHGVQTELARLHGVSPSSMFIVDVPALMHEFIGFRRGDQVMLAPVFPTGISGMDPGRAQQADLVLGALVPAARAYKEARPAPSK
ncbi:hypothetical protein WME98_39805 [Sorangium sp. So ce296]|uniref:hypothetical protein n=1 Tax=Sorangium sp. So ce296 TaxID=3133296 RepID=UPI003F628B48